MNRPLSLPLLVLAIVASPRSQTAPREPVLRYVEQLGVNSAGGRIARERLSKCPSVEALRLLQMVESRAELLAAMERGRTQADATGASWLDGEYARLLNLLGADRESVDFLEAVIAKRQRSKQPATELLLRVGQIHLGRGNTSRAKDLSDRVLAILDARPSLSSDAAAERAQAHGIRGRTYLARGLWSAAESEFLRQRELELSGKDGGFGLLNLAELEISCGRPSAAIELLEGSTLLSTSTGGPHALRGMAEFYLGIAWLQMARGESRHATQAQDLLRPLLRAQLPAQIRLRTALYLAELSDLVGRPDETRRYIEEAKAIRASTSTLPTSYDVDLLARQASLAIGADDSESIARLLREASQLLGRQRDDWAATPPTPSGEGFMAYRHRRLLLSTYFELRLQETASDAALGDCWDELLACQLLSTRARLSPRVVQAVGWDGIRRGPLTNDGGGVLFFVISRGRSHVFGLDRSGPFHASLPGFSRLIESRTALEAVLDGGGGSVAPADREGRGLATLELAQAFADDVLPAEIRKRLLGWRSVTVCDYGLLQRVPFAALPIDTESGPRLLGEMVAISHSNCLQIEHARRAADLPSGSPRVVLGAHDVAAEELKTWLSPYGPQAAIGTTLDASREAAVTQVVAHGVELDRPELFQALRIGPPGSGATFGFSELVKRELGGLAILSVCSGARAPYRTGDGGFHASLGGALLLAGSHTVMQSPAEILFEPHRELLDVFHRALAGGATTRDALRIAREAWAKKDQAWFLRFEHAQLQIAGAGHLRPFGER